MLKMKLFQVPSPIHPSSNALNNISWKILSLSIPDSMANGLLNMTPFLLTQYLMVTIGRNTAWAQTSHTPFLGVVSLHFSGFPHQASVISHQGSWSLPGPRACSLLAGQ